MLKGKTALVTGSTSGIGLGIAEKLAAQGANIILNGFGDVEAPRASVTAAGQAHGIKVGYNGADMSKPAEIEALFTYAQAEFGGVDILVNNAGIQFVANVENFPTEKWDAIIAINLSSAFHTMRLAVPGMRAKNWGRIINLASAHGLVASAGKSAYVAAKHGLLGLTKSVALETATTGVTVNAICPGWVLTPLVQKQIALLLAARQERGPVAQAGTQPDTLQHGCGLAPRFAVAAQLQRQHDVFQCAEVRDELKALEDEADMAGAVRRALVFGEVKQAAPAHQHLTTRGRVQAGQQGQQRAFARARGADDSQRFPRRHGQRDIVQNGEGPTGVLHHLVEVMHHDRWRGQWSRAGCNGRHVRDQWKAFGAKDESDQVGL